MMPNPVGYSGTQLAKKLGFKPVSSIEVINAPDHYATLFTDLSDDIEIGLTPKEGRDFIHFFTSKKEEYFNGLAGIKARIKPGGAIWISWPKKSSKVPTDLTENIIRDFAIQTGLVDIKVCAIDEIWSGLKLVIPVKDRK
ncbi:MAG TPA: hypothetical protein VHA56_02840 [Mucilaginibacter sp.]|nr:hypothetical protein [Mucilaginibacter sp.]